MPLLALGLSRLGNNPAMNPTRDSLPCLDAGLQWHNSFAQLGAGFYTVLSPQPLTEPYWVGRSDAVADLLGLDGGLRWSDALLQALSGNQSITGTQPLASVYSGHQFGHWAGQLGDGRALLLGEAGGLELQLKGSGLTPYSRMGDGRAVLRSSIREFLCSEAMHGLGIPTSRALCVTGSDFPVRRETLETAAVVTRVAPSFIRFGHFEHFSANNQFEQLKILADYVIDRFYPSCREGGQFAGNAYAALLGQVSERTALMVAHWQAVGFCHGVMNTDNMSILGLTIDFGPFQFMDVYDPLHICNHSDDRGRYAFNQQPNIAYWNLFCLGQALMPLIVNQELALTALASFKESFLQKLHQLMAAKLGLVDAAAFSASGPAAGDQALIADILALLAQQHVDYTIFWRRLCQVPLSGEFGPVRDLFLDGQKFDPWMLRYRERLKLVDKALSADLMYKSNPKYVLRNYLGELAIEAAKVNDFSGVSTLLKLLEKPYDEHPAFSAKADFAPDWASQISVSCSS